MSPQQTYGRFELRIAVTFVVVAAIFVLAASGVHSAERSHDDGSPAVLQLGHVPGGPPAASTALERAAAGPYGPAVRLQLGHTPPAASTALERAAAGPYGPAVRLQLGHRPGGSAVTSEK